MLHLGRESRNPIQKVRPPCTRAGSLALPLLLLPLNPPKSRPGARKLASWHRRAPSLTMHPLPHAYLSDSV